MSNKRNKIYIFKGLGRYNVLHLAVDQMAQKFRQRGYEVVLVQLKDNSEAEAGKAVNMLLSDKENIAFVFSMQGIINTLRIEDGRYLLDVLQVPFIGWIFDDPSKHKPRLVTLESPYTHFIAMSYDYVSAIKLMYNSDRVYFLPAGAFAPEYSDLEEVTKDIDILYTGNNEMDSFENHEFMPIEKLLIEKTLEALEITPYKPISCAIEEALNALGEKLTGDLLLELGVAINYIDDFYRNKFKVETLEAMLAAGLKVDIVGSGWDYLKEQYPDTVILHGNQSIEWVTEISKRAKIIPNTCPTFTSRINERIAGAALAKAIPFTSFSPWYEENFDLQLEWIDMRDLTSMTDRMKYVLENYDEFAQVLAQNYETALNRHTWEKRGDNVLDFYENNLRKDENQTGEETAGTTEEAKPATAATATAATVAAAEKATSTATKRVAAVICNFNKVDYVLNCVQSVLESKYTDFDIYVVDNASADDSVAQLKNRFQGQITILENEENLGGSGGFNTGIRHVMAMGYPYVWCLDNDTIIDENAIGRLVEFMDANPEVGMCGSKIVHMEDPGTIQQMGMVVDFKNYCVEANYLGHADDDQLPEVVYSDAVAACSVLVRRELIEKIGPLPEENFLYWDDTEWGMLCNQAGYKVATLGSSVVAHAMGAKKEDVNTFATYYAWRNWIRFFLKFGKPEELPNLCETFLKSIFDVVYEGLYRQEENKAKTVMFAYDDAIHGVTGKAAESMIFDLDIKDLHIKELLNTYKIFRIDTCGLDAAAQRLAQNIWKYDENADVAIEDGTNAPGTCHIKMCENIFRQEDLSLQYVYADEAGNILLTEDDVLMVINYDYSMRTFVQSQMPLFMRLGKGFKDTKPKKIGVLIGQSRYDVLVLAVWDMIAQFERRGYEVEVYQAKENEDPLGIFKDILKRRNEFSFLFSMQACINILELGGMYISDILKLPCIGWIFDDPIHHLPRVKSLESPYSHIFMLSKDFCGASEMMFNCHNNAYFLPSGGFVPENKNVEKNIDVFFSGSLDRIPDFDEDEYKWRPVEISIIEESLKILHQHPDITVRDAMAQLIRAAGEEPDGALYLELAVCHDRIERIIRNECKIFVLEALLAAGIKVDIAGVGWEELAERYPECAIYHGPKDIEWVIDATARAKVLLNPFPAFINGSHDRIVTGALCKSMVFTPYNDYLANEYDLSLEWIDMRDLSVMVDRTRYILDNYGEFAQTLAQNYEIALKNHTWTKRGDEIIDFFEENFA